MKLHAQISLVCIVLAVLKHVRAQDASLELTSTGPVSLDTPIWFNATYNDFDKKDELEYEWYDDLFYQQTFQATGPHSKWTITYNRESYLYYTGTRRVTLTVKKKYVLIWIRVATAYIDFELTDYLNGKVLIEQHNVTIPTPNYISTSNQTNLTALIHDPYDWIKWRTEEVTFSWVINGKIHAICQTPSLLINITDPGEYHIQANVYLVLADHIITTTTTTTSTTTTTTTTTTPKPPDPTPPPKPDNKTTTTTTTTTEPPTDPPTTMPDTTTTTQKPPAPNNRTWECGGWWPNSGVNVASGRRAEVKVGYFFNKTTAREPIGALNVSGKTWLKHGELLNLTILCTGSGPWAYCWKTFKGTYNVTGNETCLEPSVTNDCNFPVIHYFRTNGTHSYLIVISNDVSVKIESIPIIMYNVDRQPQLSYIIIPVSCSLVVIIIIIFGSAYLVQSRQRYSVEVADFDFGASEDVEYKTICEQLREALVDTFSKPDLEDEDSKWRERNRVVERPRILEDED